MPAALLEPSRAAIQGVLPDLTEGVIARISDPLFPASANLCQDLKNKLVFLKYRLCILMLVSQVSGILPSSGQVLKRTWGQVRHLTINF